MNKQLIWAIMLVWVSLVAASFLWNWRQVDASVMALARIQANSHFEKDMLFRRWVALQGGVYVPPTEKTPPNPYLAHLKDRDVTTTSGKALTLVNPAYMTRQVHELAAEENGVLGHVTSLKPIRPKNAPDAWERRALLTFETGAKEALSLEHMAGGPYLRFMRPLLTEAPCLKCHEAQGYKVGDVRGGISISVPFAPFAEIAASNRRTLLLGHGFICVLGLAGLWVGGRRLHRSENTLLQSLDAAKRMAAQEQLLLSSLGEGVYGVDPAGKCIFINASALDMLGFSKDEVIGQDQHQLFHSRKEDGSPYPHGECPVYLTLRDGVKRNVEDGFLRKSGQLFPVSLTVTPMLQNDAIVGAIVAFHDITERKQMEDQVRQLAFYDALTKLPNRRLLNDRLRQAMAASKRAKCYGAVMFLDLDNFKSLNDAYGHKAGDLLLSEVADRLKSCVREMDTVARFGGDEFVVMLSDLNADKAESTSLAEIVAKKIRAALAEPYVFKIQHDEKAETTVEHHCTASIGVALFINQEASPDDILKWADTAMYQAKETGRNLIRFYDPKI